MRARWASQPRALIHVLHVNGLAAIGQIAVCPAEVAKLLAVYGENDVKVIAALEGLAKNAGK